MDQTRVDYILEGYGQGLALRLVHCGRRMCFTLCHLHCVSKNVPLLTCYNLNIHDAIMTIFD